MSKLIERFSSWTEFKQNLCVLLLVTLIGAAICVPFIFLDNIGVLLGWLLGSAVNMFAYVTIAKGSAFILSGNQGSKFGYLAMVGGVLRLAFYAGALALAGFASFQWGSLAHGYCNIISLSIALMPTWLTLVLGALIRAKIKAKAESNQVHNEYQPPKEGE